MKPNPRRLVSLCEALAAHLDEETRAAGAEVAALIEDVGELVAAAPDPRPRRLVASLTALAERLERLRRLAVDDLLERGRREATALAQGAPEGRLGAVVAAVLDAAGEGRDALSRALLDALLAATGARRGLVVLYLPESTEVEVVAARDFASTNLTLGENELSRSVLRRALGEAEAVLVEDAQQEPAWSGLTSVRRLRLRSVLAVPFTDGGAPAGAVYLEDSRAAGAFDGSDLELVRSGARLAAHCLRRGRLLPRPAVGERLFLDGGRAGDELVGRDPALLAVKALIGRIADSPATVLIGGESGTGKELVARALHHASRRRDAPFVAINCAALPESLMESELFGHEKGAFTGAAERRLGRVEQAHGGTLFLDEVSELPLPLQGKLLRFLQLHELDRLGGKGPIPVDVRVVAATSRELGALVTAGRFQEALYYRLNVIPIDLPSLRQRRGDVPLLVEHFRRRLAALYSREIVVDPEVVERLAAHDFPGNVRELENLVHRLVALSIDGTIRLGDLPSELRGEAGWRLPLDVRAAADVAGLERRRRELRRRAATERRQLAERAVVEAGGNVSRAAARLGVHRVTLYRWLGRRPQRRRASPPAGPPADGAVTE